MDNIVDTQATPNTAVDSVPVSETAQPAQAPTGNPAPQSITDKLAALFDDALTDTTGSTTPPQQEQATQTPQQEQLLAGKYKTTEDLVNAYQSIQSEFTKKAQSLSEYQKQADTLRSDNEKLAARLMELSQQPPKPADQQQADELEGLDSQAYLDQFYENPRDILAKTIKSEVQRALQPLTERINPVIETVTNQQTQEKWNKAATDLFAQHTDAPEFKEDMKQYIAERGLMKSDNPAQVFQDAYMYARGLRYAPPTPVDPKALLQDPNFLNDNILNNPEIVNAILQKQMQTINSQQIPRGITGNTPGQPAAMPQTKPKTLNEAHSLFEGMFNRGLA